MEVKWLEDFLSIVETHSFSRSAELRHVTQPAFSRRIRALEAWLGADLIDRTTYPTTLTRAGEAFHTEAVALLAAMTAARAKARGDAANQANALRFALPHTLALTFFPKWLAAVEDDFGTIACRLAATNVHDAVLALVDGGCDLLICYHHPRQPVELDLRRYPMLSLGSEALEPYAQTDEKGRPRYVLPGRATAPLPYLAYAPNAYLARVTEVVLEEAQRAKHAAQLNQVYETDMAEGLKVMALEGHGIAFLPESAVVRECAQGLLARASPARERTRWRTQMDIRLYRDAESNNPFALRLWQHLAGRI